MGVNKWVWMSITGMVLVSCGCLAGSAARARRLPRSVIHGRCRQRALGRSGRAPYTGRGTQEAHMGTTSTIGWIVLAAAAVAVIVIYNRLVRWRNAVANAFAQIGVPLERRDALAGGAVRADGAVHGGGRQCGARARVAAAVRRLLRLPALVLRNQHRRHARLRARRRVAAGPADA